jgi:hypothetical protein
MISHNSYLYSNRALPCTWPRISPRWLYKVSVVTTWSSCVYKPHFNLSFLNVTVYFHPGLLQISIKLDWSLPAKDDIIRCHACESLEWRLPWAWSQAAAVILEWTLYISICNYTWLKSGPSRFSIPWFNLSGGTGIGQPCQEFFLCSKCLCNLEGHTWQVGARSSLRLHKPYTSHATQSKESWCRQCVCSSARCNLFTHELALSLMLEV